MKKTLLTLSIIFTIITLIGAGYVIYHNGKVSPGYAIIPMLLTLIIITFYRKTP